jgi:predicted transcriptional regulator
MKSRRKNSRRTAARKPARRKAAASAAKGRGRKTPATGRTRRTPAKSRKRRTAAKAPKRPTAAKRGAPKARPRKATAKKRGAAEPTKKTRRAPRAGASAERPRARRDRAWRRGLGSEAAGQSGDTEAISRAESVDSESVEELLEEGQSWEAGIVSGVEKADEGGEVRTHEVPEDDVPEEYRDED